MTALQPTASDGSRTFSDVACTVCGCVCDDLRVTTVGVVGAGAMGPITTKLGGMYEDILRGKNKKYEHWNLAV